jgi:hypothetical protein
MSYRAVVPLLTTIVVLAGLAAVPALAQSPISGCQPALAQAASAPGFLYQEVLVAADRGGEIGGPGAQSTCIAECQDGSTVTCTGSSCNATDASCPGERGSCWGSDTGTRYCPVCTCSATVSCPGGGNVSCNGTGDTCFGITGCWVSCNDNLTWCNPHGKICPVEN